MSYVALARKWRPQTFSQLVGQNHINKALINSLNQQKLHHAYLFTGTRGVGKTSIARLLAKAMNCERGISAEPCMECNTCQAIEQGRFIDLIEIDGASKTRVEDTREILENVQYAPTTGRFKVYLIDEVHMLSQHSFNALLKTLEEPPAHAKFILATTDPQKLPITVLSRCLQFNLKHLQPDAISHYLQYILDAEQFTYEREALEILANAARGSMRDALSLLDQAIASCCNHYLNTSDVKNCLGYTHQDYAVELLYALANMDARQLLEISRQIAVEGGHFRYVLDEMLSYLHQISLVQNIPGSNDFIKPSDKIIALSSRFTAEDVQLFYQTGLKGAQEMALAPTMMIGFEMTILRMYTFKPSLPKSAPILAYKNECSRSVPEMTVKKAESLEPLPVQDLSSPTENIAPEILHEIAAREPVNENTLTWSEILSHLDLQGLALSAAENAELISKSDELIVLGVERGHQSLFTPSVVSRIEQALFKYYQKKISVSLSWVDKLSSSPLLQKAEIKKTQHQQAETALEEDLFFQQLQHEFSGEVIKNSISLLKDTE